MRTLKRESRTPNKNRVSKFKSSTDNRPTTTPLSKRYSGLKILDQHERQPLKDALEELEKIQLSYSKDNKEDQKRIKYAEKISVQKLNSMQSETLSELQEKVLLSEKIMKRLHNRNKELEAQLVDNSLILNYTHLYSRKNGKLKLMEGPLMLHSIRNIEAQN